MKKGSVRLTRGGYSGVSTGGTIKRPTSSGANHNPPAKEQSMGNSWHGHNIPHDTFVNRRPTEAQGEVYDHVTAIFIRAGEELTKTLPPSRYASLALTALEEACMWAKKCVAFEVDQEPPSATPLITDHCYLGDNLRGGPCGTCGGPWERHGILPR